MRTHRQRGMTFTEMAIVAVILSIIGVVALPRFVATIERARQTEAEAHLQDIRNAQIRYFQDHSTYATDAQRGQLGLVAWPGGRYTYCVASADALDFEAVAKPPAGSSVPTIAIHKDGLINNTGSTCP